MWRPIPLTPFSDPERGTEEREKIAEGYAKVSVLGEGKKGPEFFASLVKPGIAHSWGR